MFSLKLWLLLVLLAISTARSQGIENNAQEQQEEEEFVPTVKTPLGIIAGYTQQSHGGRTFAAFEGVPFAKPPVGDLRFKDPEPVEPWGGVWEGIYSQECVQTQMTNFQQARGGEDCLYLNVYVPKKMPSSKDKLDVIVHIHGGAFMYGSAHSYANPGYLMDQELIFVTFNYRLGIFGFLSTGDSALPGNFGLKDQILALKWVQQNIAAFGGNPDSVTITGLSAGGCSVHHLYLTPQSKGLFHRGIAQSGVALNPWALQKEPLKRAQKLADLVGCPPGPSDVLAQCMRARPVSHIMNKISAFYGYYFVPLAPFSPVVEEGFLDKAPYLLIAEGRVHDLPLIVSNAADEGLLPGFFMKSHLEEINARFPELAPHLLDYNDTLPEADLQRVADEIKKFYLNSKDDQFNEENFKSFLKMFGDRLYVTGIEAAAKLQSKVVQSPVYYYRFNYPGNSYENKTEVAHGDDGQYIFYKMFGKSHSEEELRMKDIFMKFITSFAKTGKPEIPGIDWEPISKSQFIYLEIAGPDNIELNKQTTSRGLSPVFFWDALGLKENKNLLPADKDEL